MAQDRAQPALIRTRRVALVILLVAGFDAASRLWHLALTPQPRANLIYPLNSFLPNWAAVTMNVFTYGMFAAMFVGILRGTRGVERALLATFIAEVLIVPVKRYAPVPVATGIFWLQGFGALVMFLAAVQIYLRIRNTTAPPSEQAVNE